MKNQIVRLTSGEEILCGLQISGDNYVLVDPAIIVPAGNGNIGLMHWLPYAKTDRNVQISKKFVVFVVDPVDELNSKYNAMVSPIVLPTGAGEVVV